MIQLKNILYPTDFSEYSKHAEPYIVQFAKQFEATVQLLHVISLPHYAYFSEAAIPTVTIENEMREWVEQKLVAIKESIEEHGVKVEASTIEGSPFVEIVSFAREKDVDLIIMTTHGSGFIKHLLIGGTAERVVRKAPCPVLTIKNPEHEFVTP